MIEMWWAWAWIDQGDPIGVRLAPTADVGWPVNRAGVRAELSWSSTGDATRLHVGATGRVLGAVNDLGVPGPRVDAAVSLPLVLQLGAVGLGYEPIVYVDTKGTSQPSAALSLVVRTDPVDAVLRLENDFLARPLGSDEFRTGAAEVHLRFRGARPRWGIGAEVRFWTASTRGLGELDWGETYDLTGQRGEGRSHGIACLAVTVGAVRACAGWDAEAIRDAVQNRFVHQLIDDGSIPRVSRAPGPYLRVTLNPGGLAY